MPTEVAVALIGVGGLLLGGALAVGGGLVEFWLDGRREARRETARQKERREGRDEWYRLLDRNLDAAEPGPVHA